MEIDVIIPTYNNNQQLNAAIGSIIGAGGFQPVHIIVINNGDDDLTKIQNKNITVINSETNLGWTGGIKLGLEKSKSKYVVFANDDILIPLSSCRWLQKFRQTLDFHEDVAGIGPSSNCAMGMQNIFNGSHILNIQPAPFLIGFCMCLRRSMLDEVGGVDVDFQTGDDIDLAIRLRSKGYILTYHPLIFIYHHGFQTGNKLYGDATKPGGWNSREMTEATNTHLIKKHGFMKWWKTIVRPGPIGEELNYKNGGSEDSEGDAVRKWIKGNVIEVGCGATLTIPHSEGQSVIGVDLYGYGELIPSTGKISVADFISDVSDLGIFQDNSCDTIIARHILEHLIDPVEALNTWKRVARERIIIALPNEAVMQTIQLNEEHVHAFTPNSIKNLIELIPELNVIEQDSNYSPDSFVTVIEVNKIEALKEKEELVLDG